MIILMLAGIGLLVVTAIVVGIVDAAQAPTRRMIAADRKREWQNRQRLQLHGFDGDD